MELQKIFYSAVKDAQPDALVGGLGIASTELSSDQQTFMKYFFENAEDYFDYLDIHLYKDKYQIPSGVSNIISMMGYDKPLYIKEAGGPTSMEYEEYLELMQQIPKDCRIEADCINQWLIENFEDIDPKMQIFNLEASQEQNEKRDRIECRDMNQRFLIVFDPGAQKILWWVLYSPWNQYGPTPIFGKLRLLDNDFNKLPPFYCYQRMTDKISDLTSVERVSHSDSTVYLYEITKSTETIYAVWRHESNKDSYEEDTLSTKSITLDVDFSGTVTITDVFGDSYTKEVSAGSITLDVDNTPLYIEQ